MQKIKSNKSIKAFSLIEVSIVILIIGILIAGVTQSTSLYNKFRVNMAQSLTRSSPVSGIKDLLLWYETSMDNSFIASEIADSVTTKNISTWRNISSQTTSAPDATASALLRPVYNASMINGLPSLTFDGSSDYLVVNGISDQFSGSNKPATIFMVAKMASTASRTFFCFCSNSLLAPRMQLSSAGTYLTTSRDDANTNKQYTGSISVNVDQFQIISYKSDTNVSLKVNGAFAINAQDANVGTRTFENFTIGAANSTSVSARFLGEMAEFILFSRALTTEEIQAVEKYLSQKYGIGLS